MLAAFDISNPFIGVFIGLLMAMAIVVVLAGLLMRGLDKANGINPEREDHDNHGHE